jgi:hypothetical protein
LCEGLRSISFEARQKAPWELRRRHSFEALREGSLDPLREGSFGALGAFSFHALKRRARPASPSDDRLRQAIERQLNRKDRGEVVLDRARSPGEGGAELEGAPLRKGCSEQHQREDA